MSKAKSKTYLFHEISSYLPLLEGEEFDTLVEDIKLFGQIEPAVLFEGKIIDGRNRYRACKKLKIELKIREWKPSELIGMTPLQFVISENIVRRHLNPAQRSEIGLLLLEEEEKKAKKRRKETEGRPKKLVIEKKPVLDKKEFGEKGRSVEIVAPKVRISGVTLSKAKKIKQVAEKEPIIKKEWEKAKKGEKGVDTVYRKAKIIEKLPEDLKKEVRKEKPKITIEEAKVIAEIPSEVLRKQEILERERVKKRQVSEIKKKKDLAEGKVLPKPKYFDKDASKVKAVEDICKKAVDGLTFAGLEGYGKVARDACIKMMKILFEHLREELKKAGEVAPKKVIDSNAY